MEHPVPSVPWPTNSANPPPPSQRKVQSSVPSLGGRHASGSFDEPKSPRASLPRSKPPCDPHLPSTWTHSSLERIWIGSHEERTARTAVKSSSVERFVVDFPVNLPFSRL